MRAPKARSLPIGSALEALGVLLVAIAFWSVAWQICAVFLGVGCFAIGMRRG